MQPTTLALSFCGFSDQGMVRAKNEDAWLALPKEGMFVLADGMGGHQGGAEAAGEVVAAFQELVGKDFSLEEVIAQVNSRIYWKGNQDPKLTGMGSTLCCLSINNGKEAICAHVGDSRIYRLRNEALEQLTVDHSLLSELVSMGTVEKESAEAFPYKHVLTRAIGTHPSVEATMQSFPLEVNDLFLLCSDGLTNFVSDEEIAQTLLLRSSLEEKGRCLVDLANKKGGGDNITVILIQIDALPR